MSTSTTRHRSAMLPLINKEIYKKNSMYVAVCNFNKLPNVLKDIDVTNFRTKKIFKKFLKQSTELFM